ncbi:unnamed protein product [Cylicocyclus nassatus]|uniref:Uncharacterized protein n=1 Tax=Cylicocyclus nassatus TaxID=53992 RepID=A0AA36DRH5_CYLNA|nr:unnamed protein product [Cylicocyclus nassatus]
MLQTISRNALYAQGQYIGKIREYFYYINHEGMLFLDDAPYKNFTSAYKVTIPMSASKSGIIKMLLS